MNAELMYMRNAMKLHALTLLLTSAPLFAGVSAPTSTAPQSDCVAGWTLGFDALALRPFQSEGLYTERGYDFAYRINAGYDFNDCFFTKMSYFDYDTTTVNEDLTISPETVATHFGGDMQAQSLDWVVGQHFRPSEQLALSPYVGLRWAKFEEHANDSTESEVVTFGHQKHEFNGYGIVVGLDGNRSFGNNLSLYGVAKEAIVFGNTDYSQTTTVDGTLTLNDQYSEDSVASITEVGFGLQYDFVMGATAANVRLGVEGQYWAGLSGGFTSESFSDSENVGLAGFLLGANFKF